MAAQKSFQNAIKWSFAGIWVERLLVAVFTVVLAALLGPKDFGLIGIAWVFVTFIQMFLDQGLTAALVQKKDLQQEHLDAVFWMNLTLSLVLVSVSVALSHWWAGMNHAPKVATLISVLSLCVPIEALAIVQKSIFSRNMDFKSLSVRSTAGVFAGGLVGIAMAWAKFGVWSLVGQQITKDLVSLVLIWRLSDWRPRWEFSWSHLRELLSFSASNFIAQMGIFADIQSGTILVGLFLGPVPVGLYRLADRLMNSVIAACAASIQMVSLPEFSRLQDDEARLAESALTCIRLSSTITIPALAGLAAVSGPLMAMLGPEWLAAAVVLRILCVLGMVIIFAYFTGPLLQALGRPHLLAWLEWARTILGVAFLIVAGAMTRHSVLNRQIIAIAVAKLIPGVFVITPVFLYILMHFTKISLRRVIGSIMPSLIAATTIVLIVSGLNKGLNTFTIGPRWLFATEVTVGIIVGVPMLLLVDRQLREFVRRRFGSLRSSPRFSMFK